MKKFFVLLSAVGAFSFAPLSTAEAADPYTRLVGYNSCGQPIYAVFHIHGYNHCGQPVGHWVTQYPTYTVPVQPSYPVHVHRSHGHGGHSHGHHHHHHNKGGQIYYQGSGGGWGFQVVK